MSVLDLMLSRETKAEISVPEFYWDALSGASLAREWRISSGAGPSRKLNCNAAASETPPYLTESLRVGMTLQRCPPRMHRARALYHRLPPLTSHCSTALGEPVPFGQGHFKGRPPWGIQQTFPVVGECALWSQAAHTVSATTCGLQPPLCIVNGKKPDPGHLHVGIFFSFLFLPYRNHKKQY